MISTARQWVKAHNEKATTGVEGIIVLAAPDFVGRLFPSSLNTPPRGREDYAKFQLTSSSAFETYHAEETDIVVDETQRKVVYYLTARGTTKIAGDYENEYVHKLILTDDGKLVRHFDAYLDSQVMVEFMNKIQAATSAKGEE